jgi:hypothetical protein
MTLSAPTRLYPLHGARPAKTTRRLPARPTAPRKMAIPSPTTPVAPTQQIVSVEFGSLDGRTWQAIGGGDNLAAAIAFAHNSCPTDTTWRPLSWNDLYGD